MPHDLQAFTHLLKFFLLVQGAVEKPHKHGNFVCFATVLTDAFKRRSILGSALSFNANHIRTKVGNTAHCPFLNNIVQVGPLHWKFYYKELHIFKRLRVLVQPQRDRTTAVRVERACAISPTDSPTDSPTHR